MFEKWSDGVLNYDLSLENTVLCWGEVKIRLFEMQEECLCSGSFL